MTIALGVAHCLTKVTACRYVARVSWMTSGRPFSVFRRTSIAPAAAVDVRSAPLAGRPRQVDPKSWGGQPGTSMLGLAALLLIALCGSTPAIALARPTKTFR